MKKLGLEEIKQCGFEVLCAVHRVCRENGIRYSLTGGTLLGAVRHQGFIPWDDDVDVMMRREDYDRFLREADRVLDRERFFLQKEFSEHWPMFFSKLRLNGTTCLEKYHPKDPAIHQGIYMDIFPCDQAKDTEIGRRLQFLASKVVIAKSLDARGYDTDSKAKRLFMTVCRILPMAPFLKLVKTGGKNGHMRHSFLGAASRYEKNIYPECCFSGSILMCFEGSKYPVPENYDALLRQLYGEYMRLPPPEERVCKQHAILIDPDHSWEQYASYRDGMKFDVYTRSIR